MIEIQLQPKPKPFFKMHLLNNLSEGSDRFRKIEAYTKGAKEKQLQLQDMLNQMCPVRLDGVNYDDSD